MKFKIRKCFTIILIIVCISMILLLPACSKGNENESESISEKADSGKKQDLVTEEPLEISIIGIQGTDIKDGSMVQEELESMYNVRFKPIQVDVYSKEQINVLFSSGDIPDVIMRLVIRDIHDKLVDEGFLRPMTEEFFREYAPDICKRVDEYTPWAWETRKRADGNYYMVPGLALSYKIIKTYTAVARKDWMDNVGITDIPETIDEVYNMLMKFTYDDPDGNEQNDTFGLGGRFADKWGIKYNWQSVYGAFGINPQVWTKINGELEYGAVTEQYKECLKTLNKWYGDGIIDPEFITDDNTIFFSKFIDGKLGYIDSHLEYFDMNNKDSTYGKLVAKNPDAKVVSLPAYEGPKGKSGALGYGTAIGDYWNSMFGKDTSDEKVIKMMEIFNDFAKDEKMFLLTYYGIEGETYNITDDGAVEMLVDSKSPEYGLNFYMFPFYTPEVVKYLLSPSVFNMADTTISKNYAINDPFYDFKKDVGLSDKITEFRKRKQVDLDTYVEEFHFNAITGKIDINAEWDSFVSGWYENGGQEWTELVKQLPDAPNVN